MKTAMQEFIDELSFIEGLKDNEIDISQKSILTTATIKNALEKEKEQIIDAHGLKYYDIGELTIAGEEYYNQTFNQDRITISETRRSIEEIGLLKKQSEGVGWWWKGRE